MDKSRPGPDPDLVEARRAPNPQNTGCISPRQAPAELPKTSPRRPKETLSCFQESQNGIKTAQEACILISRRNKMPPGRHKTTPGWPQDGPRCVKDDPKRHRDGGKTSQETPPKETKTRPRHSKSADPSGRRRVRPHVGPPKPRRNLFPP